MNIDGMIDRDVLAIGGGGAHCQGSHFRQDYSRWDDRNWGASVRLQIKEGRFERGLGSMVPRA